MTGFFRTDGNRKPGNLLRLVSLKVNDDSVCVCVFGLQGENIDLALRRSDIDVLVADNVCDITSLSSTQVTCLPAQLETLASSPPLISTVLVGATLLHRSLLANCRAIYSVAQKVIPSRTV